jgi:DNA-binding NtrC family response regulator
MDILLSFTGFHDPYAKSLISNDELPGPILSLVKAKSFQKVILFATPRTQTNTSETKKTIEINNPFSAVEVVNLDLNDPTDYFAILHKLRNQFQIVSENNKESNYFVAVASGTPQMHACWLLLVASGEITAKILHIRPPAFVTKELPLISEVDLTHPDFPTVRSNICHYDLPDEPVHDLDTVIRESRIIGDHPSFRKALEKGAVFAPYNKPVLILGETGTGKDLIAKLIHRLSGRPSDRFIAENCATIKDLAESRLFGHKKGSFTGAVSDQTGRFDQADGGTLFLDELGELPLETQAKLLRVLQDGMIEPLGAGKSHKVDVRIIAATNKDLLKAITDGEFREDLYYRLRGCVINLPPLRDRRTDIPKIALSILDRINASVRIPRRLSPDALKILQNHSWAGNVRDLEHVIENAVILSRNDIIEPKDLELIDFIASATNEQIIPDLYDGFRMEDYLDEIRQGLIKKAASLSEGNQSQAAKLLGISQQAISKFFKRNNPGC